MFGWIKKILFKDVNKQIESINNQISAIRTEMNAITFIVHRQSELIAALAAVQSDILSSFDYETMYSKDSADGSIVHKIIMPMPDDDDLLN